MPRSPTGQPFLVSRSRPSTARSPFGPPRARAASTVARRALAKARRRTAASKHGSDPGTARHLGPAVYGRLPVSVPRRVTRTSSACGRLAPAADARPQGRLGYSLGSTCIAASSADGASSTSSAHRPHRRAWHRRTSTTAASTSSAGSGPVGSFGARHPGSPTRSTDIAGPPSAGCHICSPDSGSTTHSPCAQSSLP